MSLDKLRMIARARRAKASPAEPPVEQAAHASARDESQTAHASARDDDMPAGDWGDMSSFVLEAPKPKPTPKPRAKRPPKQPAPTVALEAVMIEAIKGVFGEQVITKKWAAKERALAKKLIDNYGAEMTSTVVSRFVAEWPNMVRQSRGRLYGLPTLNFLWATQDRFFGAAQLNQQIGAKPGNVDEYQAIEENDDDW